MTNKKHKYAAAIVSGVVAFSAFAAVGVLPAGAATVEELTSQINSLLATIAALQAQVSSVSSGSASSGAGYTFTRNLKQGDTGADVKALQQALNKDAATRIAASGAGSPGNETSSFGPATKAAVVKFQNKYASEVLTPFGLKAGTGFVGSGTRSKLNAMGGGVTTPATVTPPSNTPTPAVVVPSGKGLTVTAASMQPGAQLAPLKAARIPFTKVVFTASPDGDVTVNSLVAERVGQSVDASLDSVVLLDEQGMQVGLSKTLNSQHQTTLSTSFVVKAGQSRTMTLAANRPSSGTAAHAGMVVGLSLVQVNTSATVNGSFPITGTVQTINEGLTIGSATVNRGSLDPGTSVTKEVGITAYTFSSVRVTAGSGENLRLRSIRFNQTESASQSDLANIKVYVDGTAYTPTVTDGGQYYIATFGNGLVLEKGYQKEISIKGDVIGGSGRKIDFDIAKRTDIDLVGELYGYGIMPDFAGSAATADGAAVNNADDYYYDAAVLTIDVGSMNVSTSNAAPAQNIAINTANQPLGALIVDVKGEPISVGRISINLSYGNISTDTNADGSDITNITLVDANGSVVAGPVEGSDTDARTTGVAHGGIVFTDTVTFPIGQNTYFLKGKIGTDIDNGNTITASTTPSTDFTTVRGLTTGKTITPAPTSALTFNSMTIKSGSLTLSASGQPTARTIIASGKQIEFARYNFDASASGEDIRVTTVPLYNDGTTGVSTDLTNCQLRDGSATGISLTTGSNVKNPSSFASTTTFTFDGTGLIIPKNTSKTLSLTCDLKSGTANNLYWWGIGSGTLTGSVSTTNYSGATGLASAQTISTTFNRANGQKMTVSSGGSYTVAADTSSGYLYRAVKAGSTNVPLAAFKFTADLTEDLMLQKIALQLGNVASNSPLDLVNQRVSIWTDVNGVQTQVGTARFDGSNSGSAEAYPDYATSTLSTPFKIARGTTKTVIVKGDLIDQNANTNTTSTADNGGYGAFLAISYDGNNNGINGNYATGLDSGANVSGGTTSDATTNGVRVFRNIPTFTLLSTGGSIVAGGDLYKFRVTNPDATQDLILKKVSFSIATSGTGFLATQFVLKGGGITANSAVNASDLRTAGTDLDTIEIRLGATSSTTAAAIVPAGGSKDYVLQSNTITIGTTAGGTDSLSLSLLADTAYPSCAFLMCKISSIDTGAFNLTAGTSTKYTVWSPFSTSTSPVSSAATEENLDWTNGYGIPFVDGSGIALPPGQDMPVQTWTKSH